MSNIRFRLFKSYHEGSDVIPIAGLITSNPTVQNVLLESLVEPDYNEHIYYLKSVSTNTFITPFKIDPNQNYDYNIIAQDFLVTDNPYFDVYAELTNVSSQPNISLYELTTGIPLPIKFKLQFKNGTTWQDKPTGAEPETVRILFSHTTYARGPLRVTFNWTDGTTYKYNKSQLITNVTPIYSYSAGDWHFETNGRLLQIVTSGKLDGIQEIYVKTNTLNLINCYLPNYSSYEQWHPLIRKGTVVKDSVIYTNRFQAIPANLEPPRLVRDTNVEVQAGAYLKTSYRSIDTSKPITVYFNGIPQDSSIIEQVDDYHGVIKLRQFVPLRVNIKVEYELKYTDWYMMTDVDFNPAHGHSSGKQGASILDLGVTYWITPLHKGGLLYHSYNDEPGVAIVEGTRSRKPVGNDWLAIARVRTYRKKAAPFVVDIRNTKGGGVKEEYLERLDQKSITDVGYFDGKPIENPAIVINIPKSVYYKLISEYENEGYSALDAHQRAREYIEDSVQRLAPSGIPFILLDENNKPYF